jgi:hypothetical protein
VYAACVGVDIGSVGVAVACLGATVGIGGLNNFVGAVDCVGEAYRTSDMVGSVCVGCEMVAACITTTHFFSCSSRAIELNATSKMLQVAANTIF